MDEPQDDGAGAAGRERHDECSPGRRSASWSGRGEDEMRSPKRRRGSRCAGGLRVAGSVGSAATSLSACSSSYTHRANAAAAETRP